MLKLNTIYKIDALEGLKKLPNDSIDLVVTDPPYNIAAKTRKTLYRGKAISTMKLWGAWDCFHPFDYDLFIMQLLTQFFRVLKQGGSLYMFSPYQKSSYVIRKAVERGLKYRSLLAIVAKNPMPSLGMGNWRRGFQLCLYVSKGKPKTFNFLSQKECVNVFYYGSREKQTKHPAEKPLGFVEKIVKVSSNKDEIVFDPFMGSGTTAVACKNLSRNYIGFDNNPEYVKMARKRLR